MAFATNVFINCPFDREYSRILQPILFCVIYLGFNPRIASESLDSGQPRVTKLLKLVADSKYAIHDLSRIKAQNAGELFRLNMPFELGLDVGCRSFKSGKWRTKKSLILETERYRFQAAISDISNSDIQAHGDDPEAALRAVRDWLAPACHPRPKGPAAIWAKFEEFMADNYVALRADGYSKSDIDRLPTNEFIGCVRRWKRSR